MKTPEQIARLNTLRIMNLRLPNIIHQEIIMLLKDGFRYKAIGEKMINRLGNTSVGNHVKEIYRLLNINKIKGAKQINTHSGIFTELEMFNQ